MQHPIQQEVKRWRWEVLQPRNYFFGSVAQEPLSSVGRFAEVGRRTWTTARETVLAAPEALVTKPLQVGGCV